MTNQLINDIILTSKIGRPSGKIIKKYRDLNLNEGVSRLTGTKADKELRDFVVGKMEELNLDIKIDKVGNIFGRWEGRSNKTIMVGSHLDSVINGGHFDGALGVLSAIDAVRKLKKENFKNKRSIEIVVFTGEEGSAFPVVCLGSKVLVGKLSLEEAYKLKNNEGKTLLDVLENIGYKGTYTRDLSNVSYFLELHIEQGPVMDESQAEIGVVDNIMGISWIQARIYGKQAHAGGFPMDKRIDPTIAAADIIFFVNHIVKEFIIAEKRYSIKGTVGKIFSYPGSPNVIPGYVDLGIDIRDSKKDTFESLINSIQIHIKNTENIYKVKPKIASISKFNDPIELNIKVRKLIEEESRKAGYKTIHLDSGPTHDAAIMATKTKGGMIFVPSREGISHSPLEWTNFEDCKKGAYILKKTIEKLASE